MSAASDISTSASAVEESKRGAPAATYFLTRFVILRLLGFVYFIAFLVAANQIVPLIGEHGLLPARTFLDRVADHLGSRTAGFWQLPSLFWLDVSDHCLVVVAWIGVGLSAIVMLGYANSILMAVLWALYMSFLHIGQDWYGYGWEIQLLETGFLAIFLCPLLDGRPFSKRPPPVLVIWLYRWLIFRIMIGAGLIKLRGDPCWRDLTCLYYHYETQPIPNPISWWLHFRPHWFHQIGTLWNHIVELVVPCLAFGPRRARQIAGILLVSFQLFLIVSGNLSFLNWLTIVPALACFDDSFLRRLLPGWIKEGKTLESSPSPRPSPPGRGRIIGNLFANLRVMWSGALSVLSGVRPSPGAALTEQRAAGRFAESDGDPSVAAPGDLPVGHERTPRKLSAHEISAIVLAIVVALLSIAPVVNMLSPGQIMNTSFTRLHLVNTYGAFGSVGRVRTEIVFEGTDEANPTAQTKWMEYEFKAKPGNPMRRPVFIAPYQPRIDWQIWFAAMSTPDQYPWTLHFVWKLLHNDTGTLSLIANNPFPNRPPRYIRAQLYQYHFAPPGDPSGAWWKREPVGLWLPPLSVDEPAFKRVLQADGWVD
jgi:hypothetical protein